jgi:hypothetical protein
MKTLRLVSFFLIVLSVLFVLATSCHGRLKEYPPSEVLSKKESLVVLRKILVESGEIPKTDPLQGEGYGRFRLKYFLPKDSSNYFLVTIDRSFFFTDVSSGGILGSIKFTDTDTLVDLFVIRKIQTEPDSLKILFDLMIRGQWRRHEIYKNQFYTKLQTDNFKIYMEDFRHEFHSDDKPWTLTEQLARLCASRNSLIIETPLRGETPFYVKILKDPPKLDLEFWDQVNESSIEITSGLVISGDLTEENKMIRINLNKGKYGVVICYAAPSSNGSENSDVFNFYRVYIWPINDPLQTRLLKNW